MRNHQFSKGKKPQRLRHAAAFSQLVAWREMSGSPDTCRDALASVDDERRGAA